jgi:phosphoketolase
VIPAVHRRLFVCHTHAEVMTGVLRRLDTGPASSRFMGYRNRGGTLDVAGMQFANGQSAAHILAAARALLSGAVA